MWTFYLDYAVKMLRNLGKLSQLQLGPNKAGMKFVFHGSGHPARSAADKNRSKIFGEKIKSQNLLKSVLIV